MRKYLLVATLVTMALLAGCTGGGQTASESSPATANMTGDAPHNIETFYVSTEEGKFFCIISEGDTGYEGYRGMSCTPVSKLQESGA